jgi:hypothetical protein
VGFDGNRKLVSQSGSGAWYSGLSSWFRGNKPSAISPSGAPPVNDNGTSSAIPELLDRLLLKRSSPASAAPDAITVDTLARISKPGGAAGVSGSAWAALGQTYLATNGVGRAQMASQLLAAGFHVEASHDGEFVTIANNTVTITTEPSTQRTRVANATVAWCYSGDEMVQSLRFSGNTVTVTTEEGEEIWNGLTGAGTLNGVPIAPAPAAINAGEPLRGPELVPNTNDLQVPPWTPTTSMLRYGSAYDSAVQAMGGEVVEPSQTGEPTIDQFNCHSYGLTLGHGDLFDPFSRTAFPHWLNNPMYLLTTGHFSQLASTQRAHPGDLIVYAANGIITHTGVVKAVDDNGNPSQIESKFGTLGLYVHGPHEVPAEYGAAAALFRPNT